MPEVESTTTAPAEPQLTPSPPPSRRARARALARQLASFGAIGGIAFVVDVGVYNLLRATAFDSSPIWAKVFSVAVATVVAWVGNRYLTFRGQRSENALREGILFAAMNVIGLLIAAACLLVSHYLLGFTSQLADNISGNVVGLVLGTAFRFAAYRFFVFGGAAERLPSRVRIPLPVKRTTTI